MAFPQILAEGDYEEIRSRLGGVSSSVVSDELIGGISYGQLAELAVRRAYPNWADLIDATKVGAATAADNAIALRTAVINLTAAYLVPGIIKTLKSENISDYSYTNYGPEDWSKLSDGLMRAYRGSLGNIEGATELSAPAMQVITGPTRISEQSWQGDDYVQ